jgi:hypothetical protein
MVYGKVVRKYESGYKLVDNEEIKEDIVGEDIENVLNKNGGGNRKVEKGELGSEIVIKDKLIKVDGNDLGDG